MCLVCHLSVYLSGQVSRPVFLCYRVGGDSHVGRDDQRPASMSRITTGRTIKRTSLIVLMLCHLSVYLSGQVCRPVFLCYRVGGDSHVGRDDQRPASMSRINDRPDN